MAGLSVLSHMHTPPANQTSHWIEEVTMPTIIPLSPRWDENTPTLPSHHSGIVAHPRVGRRPVPHTEDSFLLGLMQPGGSRFRLSFTFSIEWYRVCISSKFWGMVKISLTHRLGDYLFSPLWSVQVPWWFRCSGRAVVPHICWLCLLLRFGAVVGFLGVVLATIWPRTT